MAIVKQIFNIVNDSVKDALGNTNGITQVDSSDIVSLGKAISAYDAYEQFYKYLTNRIVKTIYFVRTYKGSPRSVLRDEHDYGAFIQKVYYEMPKATANPTYAIGKDEGYKQQSPYDVEAVINVSSLIYGTQGTWTIEIIRPEEQIKTAFLNESNMMSFIDGIYTQVQNTFALEEERLVALAVNTSIANSINGKKARNLLAEYNTQNPTETLTVGTCLRNADFLKYATKEINRTISNMAMMSTVYNVDGYPTFTTRDKLVIEMLTEFDSAAKTYLQADTFHKELVSLPNFESVPYWQSSGKHFLFEDCSKISLKGDNLITTENSTGEVVQGGIICFLHDIENVAAYFGNKKTWELYNPRSEVYIHGEKASKGFAVDSHANSFVFYIAEA